MHLLQNLRLSWLQYREFRAALAELRAYSDGELAGLGVARADTVRVAYEEAERRVARLAAGSQARAGARPSVPEVRPA